MKRSTQSNKTKPSRFRQSLSDWVALLTCSAMLLAVIRQMDTLSHPSEKGGYLIPSPAFGWTMLAVLVVLGAFIGAGLAVLCGQPKRALFGGLVGVSLFLCGPLLMLIAIST